MYQDPVHIRYLALATLEEWRRAGPRRPRRGVGTTTQRLGALLIVVGTWLERIAARGAPPVVPDVGY